MYSCINNLTSKVTTESGDYKCLKSLRYPLKVPHSNSQSLSIHVSKPLINYRQSEGLP